MKSRLIFLLCFFIAGCSSPVKRACDESAKKEVFPNNGDIASIQISFDLTVGKEKVSFSEIARCEYKGRMCPAGDWWEVWHGDQSISYEINLLNDESLTIWPHSFCINLNQYKKKCSSGECNPNEHFKFKLNLSKERKEQRIRECNVNNPDRVTNDAEEFVRCGVPSVDLVTFKRLEEYGYKVENPIIKISNAGL
ncbi:hypothetical protein [Paraferrimonas haliotis]|uniref:hypothetical protein n=1 Tax=Paraferrimonas haliotis TaxID=2013866 RepID=UPI000BA95114|nr:hypothetical protein [Paraferrimonas haliotis]